MADPTETTATNPPNPQVTSGAGKITDFSYSTLLLADPVAASSLLTDQRAIQQTLVNQQVTEYRATSGLPAGQPLPPEVAAKIQADTFEIAKTQAQAQYKDQIVAAGAGTLIPADTPLPTTAASTNTGSETGGYSRMVGDVRADGAVLEKYDNNGDPVWVTRAPATDSAVSSASNPQVPANTGKIAAVSTETLLQNDPTTAQEYTAFKNETAAQLTTQRIAEREAIEGSTLSVSEQVQIAARAEVDATADANFRYQDQIEAAGAATVVPANTPLPTVRPDAVVNNPQVVVPPTKVAAVSTETLLQNDPKTAQEYTAFKNETAKELTTQRIAEREAVEGSPVSISEQVQIAARAEADATADANFRYQDQIVAAGAGTVVPANTPLPVTEAPVSTANPQVPINNTKIDGPVNQAVYQQANPSSASQYDAYVTETQNNIVAAKTKELEATQGYPASENQLAVINGEAFGTATIGANAKFKDDIQAAKAAPTVPANTPPPVIKSNDVTDDPNVYQPETKIDGPVNQAVFQQKMPAAASQYDAYVTETQNNIVAAQTKELEATQGYPATESQIAAINGQAFGTATIGANVKFKDDIQAAKAAPSVPADTPVPVTSAAEVSSATNQQVPPPSTAEALIDPQTGEVLGYIDPTTGQAVDAPTTVTDTNQAAVQKQNDSVVTSVNDTALAQKNATLYQNYQADLRTTEAKLIEDKTIIAGDVYGGAQNLTAEQLTQIRIEAATEAQATVNTQYKDQLDASGAATTEPSGTPPPTPAPAPPSPSPYERFIAQEAAATDAAQIEANKNFQAQVDALNDPQAPQAIPVDNAANIEAVPLDNNATDYGEFLGNGIEPTPVDYGQELGNGDPGVSNFYGTDPGEFQDLALEPAAADPVDYGDFIGGTGADTAFVDYGQELGNGDPGISNFYGNDAGEFQDLATEPAAGDPVDYGDFMGGTGADTAFVDYGQELGNGDGASAGFGDFFNGAGDAVGGALASALKSAAAVSGSIDPQATSASSESALPAERIKTPSQLAAEREAALRAQAKAQAQVNAQRKQANEGDWRVRIRLAAGSTYLYNDPDPGILEPLRAGGVIFPYTPQITTQYTARYANYELTHSNYKGYFYQGSNVGEINITATFTAQDTTEAEYLLAVIHFFRSVTKMFYGQDDANVRGAPPPLVFLQGLGEYQFNLSPCVVANFNYTLPADVDYIRAYSPNFDGTNLLQRRARQDLPTSSVSPVNNRLSNAGLTKGGINTPPAPPTLGINSPTYVPTKMDIQLVLLPVQTRSQVSQQFSLKQFANGNLVRGGFW